LALAGIRFSVLGLAFKGYNILLLLAALLEKQLFWIGPVRAHQPGILNVEPLNSDEQKYFRLIFKDRINSAQGEYKLKAKSSKLKGNNGYLPSNP